MGSARPSLYENVPMVQILAHGPSLQGLLSERALPCSVESDAATFSFLVA
jgi:hypothetical protein